MKKSTKIHVNRELIDVEDSAKTVLDMLAAAGFEGADWDVFELQGEGDPTGGSKIELDRAFGFESGQHFRVVPSNRNFGGSR